MKEKEEIEELLKHARIQAKDIDKKSVQVKVGLRERFKRIIAWIRANYCWNDIR